jgi:NADH-quinone oxidoreductase subunit N
VITADVTLPDLDYTALGPVIVVLSAAVIGVLVEALAPRGMRRTLQLAASFGGLAIAGLLLLGQAGEYAVTAGGSFIADGPSLFLQGTVVVLSLVALGLFAERDVDPSGDAFAPQPAVAPGTEAERAVLTQQQTKQLAATEVYPLAMFSIAGMMLLPASGDLLMLFIALELLSLPLYVMTAMARRRRLVSQEAALKYFLLGAFASAFLLYGSALLYGFSGSLDFGAIGEAVSGTTGRDPLLIAGMALVGVGLLFKVGAAPFHSWSPDVYQGAPTPVTAFMASVTKVAAFGAMLRVFYVALGGLRWDWQLVLGMVAVISMVVGTVVALTQTDVKRMLAYSSVAHAGFILTGVAAATAAGTSSVLFYLLAYGFATIGAFAVVTLVRDGAGEATHLSQWAGLGRRSPLVAGLFALFLLAAAGIPLTSGFVSKFAVFSAAGGGGAGWLVVVGVLASAVAAFFYVRVIVLMFFTDGGADNVSVPTPSGFTAAVIAICAAATVLLGVLPQPMLDLAESSSQFLF